MYKKIAKLLQLARFELQIVCKRHIHCGVVVVSFKDKD